MAREAKRKGYATLAALGEPGSGVQAASLKLELVALWSGGGGRATEVLPARNGDGVTQEPVPGSDIAHIEPACSAGEDGKGFGGMG
jgi:hypothetical protein